MAEYIKREKALKALSEARELDDGWHSIDDIIDMVYSRAEDIPAADVRPERHGRWVSWEEAGNFIPSPDRYECSICHDAAQRLCNGIDLLSDYCPNCGAKMDGKEG